jgi:hypothetical protein
LRADYRNARILVWWFANQGIVTLPPPEDREYHLVVKSTLKGKTALKHPSAKKGRLNEYALTDLA